MDQGEDGLNLTEDILNNEGQANENGDGNEDEPKSGAKRFVRGRGRGRGRRLQRPSKSEGTEIENQIFIRKLGYKPTEEEIKAVFGDFEVSDIALYRKYGFITLPSKQVRDAILSKHKEKPFTRNERDIVIEAALKFDKLSIEPETEQSEA